MANLHRYFDEDQDFTDSFTRRAKTSDVRMRMEDDDWLQSQSRKHRSKASKQSRKAVRQEKFKETNLDIAA